MMQHTVGCPSFRLVVIKATTRRNEMWQMDFAYLKAMGGKVAVLGTGKVDFVTARKMAESTAQSRRRQADEIVFQ